MKRLIILFVFFTLFQPFSFTEVCFDCHTEGGETEFNEALFSQSVHGDLSCADCHTGITESTVDSHPDDTVNTASCMDCHEEIVTAQKNSAHTNLQCTNCHSDIHYMSADQTVVHNAVKLLEICSGCHGEETDFVVSEKTAEQETGSVFPSKEVSPLLFPNTARNLIHNYKNSVHFLRKNEDGSPAAACVDCHGVHSIQKYNNTESAIYKPNISATCGKCHEEVAQKYDESVHAEGIKKGWDESPSCTCCHTSHNIKPTNSKDALTNKLFIAEKICLSCHEDERLIERYGLENHYGSTYRDSYHSMANAKGSKLAATCTDCHTSHHILKASTETSSINEKHLTDTCGKCHVGVNENFASSYTHKASLKTGNKINYYVKLGYIWLIILTIGGMWIHNFIIYLYHVIVTYKKRKKMDSIERMSKGQRMLHFGLFTSFFILVITGFSLRLSNLDFFYFIPWSISEVLRAWIHRIAGSFMGILLIVHIFRILVKRNDHRVFLNMLPVPKDLRDAVGNMRYHLFLSKKYPDLGKVTYVEKAEYLALIWGTIVMVVTGIILWFPEYFSSLLPVWAIKVSETVHFYEAILATLAILIWHLFFTIFHPEVYPLDTAFINGKMPLDEIEHMRPEYYKEIMEKRSKD